VEAVSGEVLKILTFKGSAVGSNVLAHFINHGECSFNGSQQLSFWLQLVVKE
jgi:predicted aconitase with swiveling domain